MQTRKKYANQPNAHHLKESHHMSSPNLLCQTSESRGDDVPAWLTRTDHGVFHARPTRCQKNISLNLDSWGRRCQDSSAEAGLAAAVGTFRLAS